MITFHSDMGATLQEPCLFEFAKPRQRHTAVLPPWDSPLRRGHPEMRWWLQHDITCPEIPSVRESSRRNFS